MEEGKREEKNLIELLEEERTIDTSKYMEFVRGPSYGAIATFSGTTRDNFDGRDVLELRYEAYIPMAVSRLKSACSAARASWDLGSIAVAHRLGKVPVGDASVFIAASSVHRDDALAACRFMIDEIKASVPIWKKEVYHDGEVWKENKEFTQRFSQLSVPSPSPPSM